MKYIIVPLIRYILCVIGFIIYSVIITTVGILWFLWHGMLGADDWKELKGFEVGTYAETKYLTKYQKECEQYYMCRWDNYLNFFLQRPPNQVREYMGEYKDYIK